MERIQEKRPHVEIIDATDNLSERQKSASKKRYISAGKVPGGTIQDIEIEGRMTVRDVFKKLNVNTDGCEIQLNGERAGLDDIVTEDTMTIFALPRIRGNNDYRAA